MKTEQECVWIAEVWEDGERILRVVHPTEEGAREEVDMYEEDEHTSIDVSREKVYMGTEDVAVYTNTSSDVTVNWVINESPY